jgi:hypothetical protein
MQPVRPPLRECDTCLQGLLNKKPENRLDWPDLLSHPFVKESEEERLLREQRLMTAAVRAEASMAWKGEGGAIAGAAVYSGISQTESHCSMLVSFFAMHAAHRRNSWCLSRYPGRHSVEGP